MYLFLLPMQVDIKRVKIEYSYERSNITRPDGQYLNFTLKSIHSDKIQPFAVLMK